MKPFRFLLFTLLAALASCSDGIEDVAPAITSYTGLALAVPQVTVSSASKTMNATQEECTAKDLYLFCFPVEGKGGTPYPRRNAICFETMHFPDSPNKPQWPTTTLRPGEKFRSTTIFKFSKDLRTNEALPSDEK